MSVKKQLHHCLRGADIELIPVTKEHMDFICEEESDSQLWFYEESIESDKECIRKKFIQRIEENSVFDFIIQRKVDNSYIGMVYIWQCSLTRKSWEIGYVILPEFQGKGYCVDSVKLLLAFAFNKLDAHKVLGMCHCDNNKSASIMKKVGMSKQGVFRQEYQWRGKWVDQFYFSILEEEYNKIYK